ARSYPKEYWNRVQFVCEPTGHLVAMFRLTPDGSDFKASYWGNLFASDDEWCAPIAAEVGPDGNVWVIDWYNFIVQHNPTPPGFRTGRGNAYETELRDKKYGRIYRVVPKNAKPLAALRLDNAKPEQLVETLKNDNLFWRLTAQRMLVDRGKLDVGPLAHEFSGTILDKKDEFYRVGFHTIWTLHGIGAYGTEPIDPPGDAFAWAAMGFHSDRPAYGKAGVAVLPPHPLRVRGVVEKVKLLDDPDPQV